MTTHPLRFPDNEPELDEPTRVQAIRAGPSAQQVANALRSGLCPDDRAFDRFLPNGLRLVSGQHWTPLAVSVQVARWLDRFGITTVVDIGSGAGKFCVATALGVSRCSFTGIEQRPRFVTAARSLAQLFEVEDRVRFIPGALGECSVPEADGYYLFNPFGENLFGPGEHLGDDVELSGERYERDIAIVRELFESAREGTYVVKYNGFGGQMPPSYEEILVDRDMPNVLRLWRKTRSRSSKPPSKRRRPRGEDHSD